MGDGVNIAARLEGIADAGGICLSEDAYRQVRDRLKEGFTDLGERELKNVARPVRVYAVKTGAPAPAPHASASEKSGPPRLSVVVLPFANLGGDPEQEYFVDGVRFRHALFGGPFDPDATERNSERICHGPDISWRRGARIKRGPAADAWGGNAAWSSSGREGRHGRAVILLWGLRTRPQARSLAARETCSVAGAPVTGHCQGAR